MFQDHNHIMKVHKKCKGIKDISSKTCRSVFSNIDFLAEKNLFEKKEESEEKMKFDKRKIELFYAKHTFSMIELINSLWTACKKKMFCVIPPTIQLEEESELKKQVKFQYPKDNDFVLASNDLILVNMKRGFDQLSSAIEQQIKIEDFLQKVHNLKIKAHLFVVNGEFSEFKTKQQFFTPPKEWNAYLIWINYTSAIADFDPLAQEVLHISKEQEKIMKELKELKELKEQGNFLKEIMELKQSLLEVKTKQKKKTIKKTIIAPK